MSLSGGVASAVAADRAITRYGREHVALWFADTSWEHDDLYRFIDDCMVRWGGALARYRDGRTPLEVASDASIIPNSRIAPCTRVLKIEPFRTYLATVPKPATVLLGLDWREQHRMDAPRRNYEPLGVSVDYPLMWKPIEFRPYQEVVASWGIAPPRMYSYGYPHNNCQGACVKQGVREWRRTLQVFPEKFAEARDWEQAQRAKGGPRANFTIASETVNGVKQSLTLAEIESRALPTDNEPSQDDLFSCMCGDGEI